MSSILDALKKIERDKRESQRPVRVDPETAERELIADGTSHEDYVLRLTPGRIAAGAVAVVLIFAAISVGVSWTVFRPAERNAIDTAASQASPSAFEQPSPAPVAPESSVPSVAVTNASGGQPGHVSGGSAQETRIPAGPLAAPAVDAPPAPEIPAPASVEPAAEPAATRGSAVAPPAEKIVDVPDPPQGGETPPQVAVAETPASVAWQPASSPPAVSNAPELASSDTRHMSALPLLTEQVRQRHGLPRLRINGISASSLKKPRPSVIINMLPVYKGETIPDTNAVVVDMDMTGVAVEIDGKRYFIPG